MATEALVVLEELLAVGQVFCFEGDVLVFPHFKILLVQRKKIPCDRADFVIGEAECRHPYLEPGADGSRSGQEFVEPGLLYLRPFGKKERGRKTLVVECRLDRSP